MMHPFSRAPAAFPVVSGIDQTTAPLSETEVQGGEMIFGGMHATGAKMMGGNPIPSRRSPILANTDRGGSLHVHRKPAESECHGFSGRVAGALGTVVDERLSSLLNRETRHRMACLRSSGRAGEHTETVVA